MSQPRCPITGEQISKIFGCGYTMSELCGECRMGLYPEPDQPIWIDPRTQEEQEKRDESD